MAPKLPTADEVLSRASRNLRDALFPLENAADTIRGLGAPPCAELTPAQRTAKQAVYNAVAAAKRSIIEAQYAISSAGCDPARPGW